MPWNVYYYFHFICIVRSTFFEGVRPMLELNILQQSDTSSPLAYCTSSVESENRVSANSLIPDCIYFFE